MSAKYWLDTSVVLRAFRKVYATDQEQRRARPLAHYQKLFPGHEALIARECARLKQSEPAPPSSAAEPEPSPDEVRMLGHYSLIRELGRGGQGQVFLAEDTQLERKVALKILAPGFDPTFQERFRREAAAASRLDHPGICAVYEAGDVDGTHFIAMRYVEGESLAQKIKVARDEKSETPTPAVTHRSGPVTREEFATTLRVVERALRAIHVAHEVGLIHRDIKPGNIMVDPNGEPVILDFGLASDATGHLQTLTVDGDLMGTPAYMSPEQLAAHRIQLDRRTDVYSMGVTLYECVTLHRPFDAPTLGALYQRILATDAPDPRRYNARISKEIKVILETALDKDRDRRYQTALDFAEDLRRARSLEPIRARPAGVLLRFWRWVQRQPLVASMVLSLFVLLAAGLTVALTLLGRVGAERDAKQTALTDREQALQLSEGLRLTLQAIHVLDDNPGLSLRLAIEGARRNRDRQSTAALLLALERLREVKSLTAHTGPVRAVAYGGNRLVTASEDGTARLWDAESGEARASLVGHEQPVLHASFDPGGERVLTTSADGTARLWNAASGEELLVLQDLAVGGASTPRATAALFDPSGAAILYAKADGTALLRPLGDDGPRAVFKGHDDLIIALAFSPDGRRVATSSVDGTARIWDRSGNEIQRLYRFDGPVYFVAFTLDGRYVMTESRGQVQIWDPETGDELAQLENSHWPIPRPYTSPDGGLVLTAAPEGLTLYDLATGSDTLLLEQPAFKTTAAAFSADGRRLFLAAGGSGSVHVVSAETGDELAVLEGHTDDVTSIAVTPDGRRIATASADHTVRIWDVADEHPVPFRARAHGAVHLSDNGRYLVADCEPPSSDEEDDETTPSLGDVVQIWPLVPGTGPVLRLHHEEPVSAAAVHRDGKRVVTACRDGVARIWDLRTGAVLAELADHPSALTSVAFHPDRRHLVTGCADGTAHVWKLPAQEKVAKLLHGRATIDAVTCSADGKRVLTRSFDRAVLWDCRDWSRVAEIGNHSGRMLTAVFSNNGKLIATAGEEKKVRLWAAHDGHEQAKLDSASSVTAVRFGPDDRQLVAAGADGRLVVWSVESGQRERILHAHGGELFALELSPDGSRMISASADLTARVWDTRTWESTPLPGHPDAVHGACFHPTRPQAATVCADGLVRIWSVATGDVMRIVGGERSAHELVFTPDGRAAVVFPSQRVREAVWQAASRSPAGGIWSVPRGRRLMAWQGAPVGASATRPLFLTTDASHVVAIREAGTLATRVRLEGHRARVGSAEFSPDGRLVATASLDGTAAVWDVPSGERRHQLPGHPGGAYVGAWSGDASRLLTYSRHGLARVWHVGTGERLATFSKKGAILALATLDHDGGRILAPIEGGFVQLWDGASGEETRRIEVPDTKIHVARFSPDGRWIATGSADGLARLFDAATLREVFTLEGHEGAVTALAFHPKGKLLATGSADHTLRMWDLDSVSVVVVLEGHEAPLRAIAFSGDGKRVMAADRKGGVRVWPVDPLQEALRRAPHDLSPQERQRFHLAPR